MSFLEAYYFLKEHGISKTQMDLIVEVVKRNEVLLRLILLNDERHWSELSIETLEKTLKIYNKLKEPDLIMVGNYIDEIIGSTSIMYVGEEKPGAIYVLGTEEEIEKVENNIAFTKEEKEAIAKRKQYTYEEIME